ncbi:MAG: LysR family transcriptional regulator [Pseudomonadota bacterium]
MTLSLKAMAYFVTALRHGNIAKAAAELNIAASAVSAAIDQVEATFDLTLVTRQRSRGIQATASGRTVAKKCERLLEDYQTLLAEGADLKKARTGSLKIGYYAPIAPAFLPGILRRFATDMGQIELQLEECDNDTAQDGLLNGKFDIILFVSEGVRPTIEFDVLIVAPAYCLLPAEHPLASQSSVTMAQIVGEPLIVLNRPTAAPYYSGLLGAHAQDIVIAAYANSTEMVRSLVGAGLGCAILNMKPMISTSYSADDLVERPISDTLPALTLSIAYDKSRPRQLVRDFADACIQHFQGLEGDRCVVG